MLQIYYVQSIIWNCQWGTCANIVLHHRAPVGENEQYFEDCNANTKIYHCKHRPKRLLRFCRLKREEGFVKSRFGAGQGEWCASVWGGCGLVGAGLQLKIGGWRRGRGGRGRGGGLILLTVLRFFLSVPDAVRGQRLLQHRAVLPPVVNPEVAQGFEQVGRRTASSLLTLLLLSPRTGLGRHQSSDSHQG